MAFNVIWIRDNQTLADYCTEWQNLPFITLDTEFLRETTFYPIAGLIQLSDGQTPFLIDPLAISDWSAFASLLQNSQVVKVLHACNEDLEVFFQLTGVMPQPVFDTQIASALLEMGITLGYSTLAKQLLDIDISKEEKRSDWLKRPLSAEQEQYAATDVVYLVALYHYFAKQLPVQKIQWLYEDTAELAKRYSCLVDPQTLYQDSRQCWRLSSQQLAILKALYAWRENEGRTHNIARGHLAKDHMLLSLAKTQPTTMVELARVSELHPRTLRKQGETLLSVINQAAHLPPKDWPKQLPKPLPPSCGKISKQLKELITQKANELNICTELLWRKRIIEEFLRTGYPQGVYHLPPSLHGWRRQILGEILLKTLNRV